ncbi:hypothetical protein ACH4VR_36115 [Streptomyces sp. NPDC020883]|uniref:hypothetical protein n=1 Tax=Streptomyces sp. NPDC020883 TaxID=3365099 RepID=UPI00378933CD
MTDTTGPKLTEKTRTFDVSEGAHITRRDFSGFDFEAHGVTLFVHEVLFLSLSGGGMRRRWVVRYAEGTATMKAGTFLVLRGDCMATPEEAVALAVRRAKALVSGARRVRTGRSTPRGGTRSPWRSS